MRERVEDHTFVKVREREKESHKIAKEKVFVNERESGSETGSEKDEN